MREGCINTTERTDEVFVLDSVIDEISRLPQSKDRDVLLNNLGYAGFPHVICLSDYNNLLELAGEPTLELASDEAAIYRDSSSTTVRDIILSITDNGSGVKSYDLPYIFQKGFTGDSTSNRNKATGMGLYLTKKMADDLNLRLDVESEYNRFFKISIFFPVS